MKTENFTKINPFSLAHTHFSCLFQAGIYADEGISGTDTKKRDEFNRMMDNCAAGEIDLIITKSISRFARNTVDCLRCIRKLKSQQIAVYFEKENINTLDAKGEVLITIMASLAQQESQSISQNVKMGIHYQFQQGKVRLNHTCFLGYTKDSSGNLIVVQAEADIVRRIFREFLAGKSTRKIALDLTRDGIPTASGHGKWHDSTIRSMLRNEKKASLSYEEGQLANILDFIRSHEINGCFIPETDYREEEIMLLLDQVQVLEQGYVISFKVGKTIEVQAEM